MNICQIDSELLEYCKLCYLHSAILTNLIPGATQESSYPCEIAELGTLAHVNGAYFT